MKIKSIEFSGYSDVYNMEVEETHSFAVQGGIIVHNCYDETRYAALSRPITPQRLRDNNLTDIQRHKKKLAERRKRSGMHRIV